MHATFKTSIKFLLTHHWYNGHLSVFFHVNSVNSAWVVFLSFVILQIIAYHRFLRSEIRIFRFFIFNHQLHHQIHRHGIPSNPLRYETRSLYLKLWTTCRSCSQLSHEKNLFCFVGDYSIAVTWGVQETSIRIPINQLVSNQGLFNA